MQTLKFTDWDCLLIQRAILIAVNQERSSHTRIRSYLQAEQAQQYEKMLYGVYKQAKQLRHTLNVDDSMKYTLLDIVKNMQNYDKQNNGTKQTYYDAHNYTALIHKLS